MNTQPDTAYNRLREVRTADDLLHYFVDQLDWPLEDDSLLDDPEELMFEWDLEDMGIPRAVSRPVERVRQVRPFTETQPWGIYFIELATHRFLIGQIRRILEKLVTRRRTSAHHPNQRSWALNDLIFIVTTGCGDSTELHLVVFCQVEGRVEFRCLPWRPTDPTGRLRRLAEEILPQLRWPENDDDTQTWKYTWRQPFTLRPGEVITSAARLADRMALTAQDLRHQISEALADESGTGPFTELMTEVRDRLVGSVDEAVFSDMCAQTLVYGLLGSRVSDPDGFGATPALSAVPLSNPFLSAFFEQVHGEATVLDLEGSGLDQLIADLRRTDVESILDEFGSTKRGGDPVIHFYEEFLKTYDKDKQLEAGTFYTPQPVVEFMVRGTDHLLRSRFGLSAGVADDSTWQQVADNLGISLPQGVDPLKQFVSMIDPATGTGTFLVQWLRQAKQSLKDAHPDRNWKKHLTRTVLPAIHAFERELGPYAIAHLKTALHLHDQGIPTDGARILLTDTLDHEPPQMRLDMMADPVAEEGQHADRLKRSERFTAIIGNPPWRRQTSEAGDDTEDLQGGVVRYGAAGLAPLIEDVTRPLKAAGLGRLTVNVYNLYVYFWRWAIWQATQLPDGPGVVAFITASSYLEGLSMGGLRSLLRDTFDEIVIVNLGGEGRGALIEENIFDIQTPAAIAFCVRTRSRTSSCRVRYIRISGTRQEMFDQLTTLSLDDVVTEVPGQGIDRFIPHSSDAVYWSWPTITDLFPWSHPGCMFQRAWPIGEEKGLLRRRWTELVTAVPRRRAELLKETRDRKVSRSQKPLLGPGQELPPLGVLDRDDQPESIEPYGYRSFDRQWAIADKRVADMPRPVLWRIRGESQLLLTTLTSTRIGNGPALTVTPYVADKHHFSGRGGKDVIPVYRDGVGREPNLPYGLLEALSQIVRRHLTVEDLVAYVHALLGTKAFADRFADELAEIVEPVHIPITTNPDLFDRAVELGRELLWYHTWGERFQPDGHPPLPDGNILELASITGYPATFHYRSGEQILQVGTGQFGPVSQDVWDFQVSGLKVLPSWLGYRMSKRKGRKSSPLDDIRPRAWVFTDELLRLISILQHTVDLTPCAAQLLDDIIDSPLISTTDLPQPTASERKEPRT